MVATLPGYTFMHTAAKVGPCVGRLSDQQAVELNRLLAMVIGLA